MHQFELRPEGTGWKLSGGLFAEPVVYPEPDREHVIRVVDFLSQRHGSVLKIFDDSGTLIDTQRYQGKGIDPA